jgi:hypothetical protein
MTSSIGRVCSFVVVIAVAGSTMAEDPSDATTTFTDEKAFLLANPAITKMESFEGLTATNSYTTRTCPMAGFVIDIPDTPYDYLGIWNIPFVGGFATQGANWLGFQSNTNERLRWIFDHPINAFGVNITDWGDFGTGSLTFSNDAGDNFVVAVTPLGNGNQQFFGVINDGMSFTAVEFNQDISGEFYGVDEIYSGPLACATPANVLVAQGKPSQGIWHYYYGGSEWTEMTAAINAAAASVFVAPDLESLPMMLTFDALWVDQRGTDSDPGSFLTATEIANIETFIRTGRRVVMMGDNTALTNWNNQILGIVSGSFAGFVATGVYSTSAYRPPTTGVETVRVVAGGSADSGRALDTANVTTMWPPSDGVLTVLDVNLWSEGWADEDNALFAVNVARWIGCSVWQDFIFWDGFESGDPGYWSSAP